MADEKTYVVQQGDYLTKIAYTLKLDEDVVYTLPANEELFTERDPNLLAAADVLVYEVPTPAKTSVAGGSSNSYATPVPKVLLKLDFWLYGATLANESFTMTGAGAPVTGTTDGDGYAELSVPVTASTVTVAFRKDTLRFQLQVGYLEPVETFVGVVQRLASLRYLYLPDDLKLIPRLARVTEALKQFQSDNDLPPNGERDEATMNALYDSCGY